MLVIIIRTTRDIHVHVHVLRDTCTCMWHEGQLAMGSTSTYNVPITVTSYTTDIGPTTEHRIIYYGIHPVSRASIERCAAPFPIIR